MKEKAMIKDKYPYYLANKPVDSQDYLNVIDKYSGEVATKVALADRETIDTAISASVKAAPAMASMKAYERQEVLEHCVQQFRNRFDELAFSLCVEAGKPIKDARGEVSRLIDTFKVAAEESVRIHGEVIDLEISPRAKGYRGMTKKVPIGPCSFISPFNFPLNLAAHKIAPALAVGCPFILKPASRTPIGALLIGEILSETNLPEGAFSILPCHRDGAELFTEDDRLKLLSFTGSPEVGWALKAKAGKKPVILELGGNAACIVDQDANIEDAIERIIIGAFYQSGQSCIGVQRIMVHADIYDSFKEKFIGRVKSLIMGDPKNEDTFIGPMIDEKEAKRLDDWIQAAVASGGKLLCGGKREGAMLEATVVEDAPKASKLNQEEAFGPVAILSSFSQFKETLDQVNDSRFGLQAGIFTQNISHAYMAWDELDVGGVVIGDVPSWRVDHMPYGGVKDSGLGREGIKYAMEDMLETRLMVLRFPE